MKHLLVPFEYRGVVGAIAQPLAVARDIEVGDELEGGECVGHEHDAFLGTVHRHRMLWCVVCGGVRRCVGGDVWCEAVCGGVWW